MPATTIPTESNISAIKRAITRHHRHWMDNADYFFLVEGHKMFGVFSHFIHRESAHFPKGHSSPECAYELPPDVTVVQLSLFFDAMFDPTYGLLRLTQAEWISVLSLATAWAYREIKELALRRLEETSMALVDRIALYETHNIDDATLLPFYLQLCVRDEPLTLLEGRKLNRVDDDGTTLLIVSRAREYSRTSSSPTLRPDGTPWSNPEERMRSILCKIVEEFDHARLIEQPPLIATASNSSTVGESKAQASAGASSSRPSATNNSGSAPANGHGSRRRRGL